MTARVKVLLFIPNLQQGGAERQMVELFTRLPRDRYDVSLCVWKDVVHYRGYLPDGEPRFVLGVDRMGRKGLDRLVEVLRQAKPDILHSYRDKANMWARLAVRRAPVPVVLTRCGNQSIEWIHRIAERFLQGRSDRVLTNSRGVRRELIEKAWVRPDRIQVIHNFIDLARYRPPSADERALARTRWGLSDGDTALLLPGRVSRQKNQMGLALALRHLARRGEMPPGLRVLLAGRDRDRLASALLPRRLRRFALDDRVMRLGTVAEQDMSSLYHAVDALLMPSRWEGLPNAVIEGCASGLPAIVSRAANEDGLVISEETGFEVPTGRTDALADAIARIAALPHDERRRMGAAGRAHVTAMLDPDRVLGETLDLYEHLLAVKCGAGAERDRKRAA